MRCGSRRQVCCRLRATRSTHKPPGRQHHVALGNMPDADHNESAGDVLNNLPGMGSACSSAARACSKASTAVPACSSCWTCRTGRRDRAHALRRSRNQRRAHPEGGVRRDRQSGLDSRRGSSSIFAGYHVAGTGVIVHVAVDVQNWRRAYVLENTNVRVYSDVGATWTECTVICSRSARMRRAEHSLGGADVSSLVEQRSGSCAGGGHGWHFSDTQPRRSASAVCTSSAQTRQLALARS